MGEYNSIARGLCAKYGLCVFFLRAWTKNLHTIQIFSLVFQLGPISTATAKVVTDRTPTYLLRCG